MFLMIAALLAGGCKKYLDEKPDKKLAVPGTAEDLQVLLNNTGTLNICYPGAGQLASDDIYISTDSWKSLYYLTERNSYVWAADVFNDIEQNDWSLPYAAIYYCNVVIDALKTERAREIPASTGNDLLGQSLFFRAYSFYHLLQEFGKPFDNATAGVDPGIPLRLVSDLNEKSVRATVLESYQQVINDALQATNLLSASAPYKTRPTKRAGYALLARTFLAMHDYPAALKYADSALLLDKELLDYNNVVGAKANPFQRFNSEVIFHSSYFPMGGGAWLAKVDSTLYSSYASEDLRKTLFFKIEGDNTVSFRGSYDGSIVQFNGLANDELFLVTAECYARMGDKEKAMARLNALLQKRYMTGTYIPMAADSPEKALDHIITERRKELVCRGIRWADLRRLNRESRYQTTIIRVLDGVKYTLPPNDKRYTFPIPRNVIQLTGMPQN